MKADTQFLVVAAGFGVAAIALLGHLDVAALFAAAVSLFAALGADRD